MPTAPGATSSKTSQGSRFRIPGAALLVVDAFAWCVAVVFAMAIRFDFDRGLWTPWTPEVIVLVAVVVMASIGGFFGLYDGRWRRGSLDEGLALSQAVGLTCVVALLANEFIPGPRIVPVSVVLAAGPIAFSLTQSATDSFRTSATLWAIVPLVAMLFALSKRPVPTR